MRVQFVWIPWVPLKVSRGSLALRFVRFQIQRCHVYHDTSSTPSEDLCGACCPPWWLVAAKVHESYPGISSHNHTTNVEGGGDGQVLGLWVCCHRRGREERRIRIPPRWNSALHLCTDLSSIWWLQFRGWVRSSSSNSSRSSFTWHKCCSWRVNADIVRIVSVWSADGATGSRTGTKPLKCQHMDPALGTIWGSAATRTECIMSD